MTYDRWKTTDPREYEREQDDDPPSELDLAYGRIIELEKALKPFARIGVDVLKNHPGWANHVFSSEWCGYRLTYVDFERAAAALSLHNGGKAQP